MARPKKPAFNEKVVKEKIEASDTMILEEILPAKKETSLNVDINKLINNITESVTAKLQADFEEKLNSAIEKLSKSSESRRDRLVLTGEKQYFVEATADGLQFNKESDTVLLIGKNGQLAAGTKSPKTVGKGSGHFKAGAASEAVIPSSGTGSTRGIIVEGDGDDDKTFVFRAVSRMNRQGTNIFSDGSVSVGAMQKINNATFGVYHRHPVDDAVSIKVPSLQFEDSVINIDVDAASSSIWSALSVSANKENVFKVDGTGSAYSAGEFYSNSRGYAEMFEWADKNNRNEERVGFTVAFDSTGKIISADEGDNVIGVVVNSAAFVGNTAWNHWQGKKLKNSLDKTATTEFHVIEWLEMETSLLKSFDKTTVSSSFIMPENAAEIQSDSNGNSFVKTKNSSGYDSNKNYVSRINRSSWEIVCVLGVAPVYKGQQTGKNWVKIKSLNDELELWLIR
jgi:hypothetical protein